MLDPKLVSLQGPATTESQLAERGYLTAQGVAGDKVDGPGGEPNEPKSCATDTIDMKSRDTGPAGCAEPVRRPSGGLGGGRTRVCGRLNTRPIRASIPFGALTSDKAGAECQIRWRLGSRGKTWRWDLFSGARPLNSRVRQSSGALVQWCRPATASASRSGPLHSSKESDAILAFVVINYSGWEIG